MRYDLRAVRDCGRAILGRLGNKPRNIDNKPRPPPIEVDAQSVFFHLYCSLTPKVRHRRERFESFVNQQPTHAWRFQRLSGFGGQTAPRSTPVLVASSAGRYSGILRKASLRYAGSRVKHDPIWVWCNITNLYGRYRQIPFSHDFVDIGIKQSTNRTRRANRKR